MILKAIKFIGNHIKMKIIKDIIYLKKNKQTKKPSSFLHIFSFNKRLVLIQVGPTYIFIILSNILLRVPGWWIGGGPSRWELSDYNTESLTVDHNG
jgi:hypothetical protein